MYVLTPKVQINVLCSEMCTYAAAATV